MSELKHWWLVRDFYWNRFVDWRYVFCASRSNNVSSRIITEFEYRYGYRPAGVRKMSLRGWLVGPVEGK